MMNSFKKICQFFNSTVFKQLVFGAKILITLGLFIYFWQQLELMKVTKYFHPDEYIFVRRAEFLDLYLNGDFNNPVWQSYDSYDVPKFAEYIYGFSLYLQGHTNLNQYFSQVQFIGNGQDELGEGNWQKQEALFQKYAFIDLQKMPLDILTKIEPILLARQAATLFSLGLLIAVFIIGLRINGWLTGIIASILVYNNFLSSEIMVKAMGDSVLIFLILAHFLLTLSLIKKFIVTKKLNYWLLLIIGITGGLATATKLNGGLTAVYFSLVLLMGLIPWSVLTKQKMTVFFKGFGSLVISFMVFCLINPFTWKSPISESLFMIKFRQKVFIEQQTNFPYWTLTSLAMRLQATDWKFFIPKAEYANFTIKAPFLGTVTLDIWITVAGLLLICWQILYGGRQRKYYFAFLLWLMVMIGSVVLLIPLDWDRYYYPVIISIALIQALVIGWGLKGMLRFFKNKIVPLNSNPTA